MIFYARIFFLENHSFFHLMMLIYLKLIKIFYLCKIAKISFLRQLRVSVLNGRIFVQRRLLWRE